METWEQAFMARCSLRPWREVGGECGEKDQLAGLAGKRRLRRWEILAARLAFSDPGELPNSWRMAELTSGFMSESSLVTVISSISLKMATAAAGLRRL